MHTKLHLKVTIGTRYSHNNVFWSSVSSPHHTVLELPHRKGTLIEARTQPIAMQF